MTRSGPWSAATPWRRGPSASRSPRRTPPSPPHRSDCDSRTAASGPRSRGRLSDRPDSYEVAVERLEEIIDRLDSGQAGLRETLDLCREGRELVSYCAGELDAVGEGLRELRLDERAARLGEAPAGPPPEGDNVSP